MSSRLASLIGVLVVLLLLVLVGLFSYGAGVRRSAAQVSQTSTAASATPSVRGLLPVSTGSTVIQGQITAVTAQEVTVQTAHKNVRSFVITPTTWIIRRTTQNKTDLAVNQSVLVVGTTNNKGGLDALYIQLLAR